MVQTGSFSPVKLKYQFVSYVKTWTFITVLDLTLYLRLL